MKRLLLLAALVATSGCAARATYVPGTRIPYSTNNKSVLDAVENYRLAVEARDSEKLLLMAHKTKYWEDSGTPTGSDDYGFDGLAQVLTTRLQSATEIRYSLRYMRVQQQCSKELLPGCQATVDVLIDASYTIQDVHGKQVRPDKRDQNQFLLEWDGQRWLFISGM
ncbi:MAG TPA: hypothetical protein VGM39_25510 [Kofleriaceae bacterium]